MDGSMDGSMNDARAACAAIEREWARSSELLRRIPDGAWATATRCAGWTITDLVAHMCWGTTFEADGLRRARTEVAGVAEGEEVGAERAPDVLRAKLATNAGSLVAELDAFLDEPHDRAVPMPYGALPIALALDVFAMEAGVHTSDLASALGEEDRLELDVCRATLEFLRAFGPAMAGQGGARLEPGESVGLRCSQGMIRFAFDDGGWHADRLDASTTITGDDSDVVLFALGRRPVGVVTVEGNPEVAARFKDLIPGP
jgi:uncharacterized protein (TIGR03083 family)